MQEGGQSTSSFFNGFPGFRECQEQGWFYCLDQLPPLIDFAGSTIETIPSIAVSTNHFTCVLVDEDMPQRPGIGTEEQCIYSMLLYQDTLFLQ